MFPVVQELATDGVPVAVTCRVLKVSTSGYYEWRARPASSRDLEQAYLMNAIHQVHAASYGTYGHRRVHAELTMGRRLEVSHGRVERLMRSTGLQGVHRRRLRGCTRRDEAATPSDDLVERNFTPEAPDRLYVADVTQHRTSEGWLYCAVVIDCFSRRVVGWSIPRGRGSHPFRARRRCLADGDLAPPPTCRGDPPQRPRLDLHQLGIRAPAA